MQKLIVGNLKMNILSMKERDLYIQDFKKELKSIKSETIETIICVPTIHLEAFTKKIKENVGVQNVCWEDKGSFTGELSPLAAANFGAKYAIIGHSERRRYFGETNENCNLKIKAALKNKLTPIYCIGETREEKENGTAAEIIIDQITQAFVGINSSDAKKIVIAYEPVWSVGSDQIPTSDEILEIKILLKKTFAHLYDLPTAEKILVLYGGSVKADTVKQVCLEPGLDGVLVGRESLIPRDFIKIVKVLEKEK